jgi:hypothetical protein
VYIATIDKLACMTVRPNDRFGIYSGKNVQSVAYVFEDNNPSAIAHSFYNYTDPVEPGIDVLFDPLTFPFNFSVAAFYLMGKYRFFSVFGLLLSNYIEQRLLHALCDNCNPKNVYFNLYWKLQTTS